ncbi:glycine dehydrogenase (aminomethyl-transferring) [Candidatus Legionella polyplacis]|uniref:aminomethyl-transferring glycine dehydrogenase subunit GcvPB n=1 Tax=Candidatus Legionella polyplacis TaxID=2005262 RepID=UPI000C1EC866|nr:aminomethyl-transferring glycine dehydrogenase subunit GcvPB [Candidatus Legionella polyplacis]ATW01824.1 glycine dehydrogenase (aminomethyl-transferring) [Candidatus Legionella polyplacis]
MLIFELSDSEKKIKNKILKRIKKNKTFLPIPEKFIRKTLPYIPNNSNLQVIRHYTKLSQKNYSIDTNFYPLGSCTMKYNPKEIKKASSKSEFINQHPLTNISSNQGTLKILYELQTYLSDISGMPGVSLTPMAGSQGEFAAVSMIKAYFDSKKEFHKNEIIIPEDAHGTNAASASMCGFKVITIQSNINGNINIKDLKNKIGENTAVLMLTNPSTLGLFIDNIKNISDIVHQYKAFLYYDGANLNAILGKIKPIDMGFDLMHINLHKTFGTPHGSGGPGSGPITANAKLTPYLPIPLVKKKYKNFYYWSDYKENPNSIGRLSCFMGNINVLIHAYFYIRLLGKSGLSRVSDYATLNANYLLSKLKKIGFSPVYPSKIASHEFLITLKNEKIKYKISAKDLAKRLLDYDIHPPTIYFPISIPECLLIEPTETESKKELDYFIKIMKKIYNEITNNSNKLENAPHKLSIKRIDEIKANKKLNLNYFKKT